MHQFFPIHAIFLAVHAVVYLLTEMVRCLPQDLRARAVPLPSDQLEVPVAH